ncbi:MAG: amidohydrolase family protein [bacterium]|nr:amidohydrolase family protein [bacterium]
MIIDTHTHIYNEKTYHDYFTKTKGRISKTIAMSSHKGVLENYLSFAATKDNLYFIGSVNIEGDIKKQLESLEKAFQENKLFGIKLYPGYQYFYPSDEKVYPIAELCQKYNRPLIFHSGDVWNPEGDAVLKYSHPIYIDELAVRFPKCKIIISHFGFPYHLETANILSKNKNVFSEISGTIDQCDSNKDIENIQKQYIKDLHRVFAYFPNVKEKTMFGTDYSGEDTPLNLIEPYIEVIENVFSKKEQQNVFSELAEKLFFH